MDWCRKLSQANNGYLMKEFFKFQIGEDHPDYEKEIDIAISEM